MHIETSDITTVYFDISEVNVLALLKFKLTIHHDDGKTTTHRLLATCEHQASKETSRLRRLYDFAGLQGLNPLDLSKHPFLSSGTVDDRSRRFREVEAFLEEELAADDKSLGIHMQSLFASYHLLKPELPEEQPRPVVAS